MFIDSNYVHDNHSMRDTYNNGYNDIYSLMNYKNIMLLIALSNYFYGYGATPVCLLTCSINLIK